MSLLQNSNAISTGGGYNLESSLRFRSSASAYLERTPSTAGNRRTWTWSGWVKRGELSATNVYLLFGARNAGTTPYTLFYFDDDNIKFNDSVSGTLAGNSLYRDTSAWYHLICAVDTTQATSSNRVKIYVNGEQLTSFSTATYPSLNADLTVNSTYSHAIGAQPTPAQHFDGYMTEVNFVDGQALTPSDFGETDTTTGVWKPKEYTGTYGTNGFYLPMKETQQATGFNTVLWTGNGGTQTIDGVGFSPDLVWLKNRGTTNSHYLTDSVRGDKKSLNTNATNAEFDYTSFGGLSLVSNGFYVETGTSNVFNTNGNNFVAWCWDAGSSTVSNTDGTITSSVRANPATGFSIVTYTGNTTAGATVGHGLGSAPDMIIIKDRDTVDNWAVYHSSLGGGNASLFLEATNAVNTSLNMWNSTAPSSSVITLGDRDEVNRATAHIAYCFAEVSGYSKFGSYTGTGASNNNITGLGFEPAFVMIKRTDSTGDWQMYDNTRDIDDPRLLTLYANGSFAEDQNATNRSVDFDSDGFTIDSSAVYLNASGGTYIYMAFADTRDAQFNFDASGNKNNWTANNINSNASSETTYDIMNDVPTLTDEDTANYPTINPVDASMTAGTITNANLTRNSNGSNSNIYTTMGTTTGKYYYELDITGTATGNTAFIGWAQKPYTSATGRFYNWGTAEYFNGTAWSSYGATCTSGDTVGIAIDIDGDTIEFYKNGVSQGQKTSVGWDTTNHLAPTGYTSNSQTADINLNFGQRPFAYTPPTGYKKLNTYNLPDSTIKDGSEYFITNTFTGTGSTLSIDTGFSPDFVWLKSRSFADHHLLYDSIRGANQRLYSSLTNAESTATNQLNSFDSNGYTLGSDPSGQINVSGQTSVGWSWRGSDSSPVSNTDGTITSTVSANTNSGFSVITFTGNGTAGATIGHGLGAKPAMIIVKNRTYGVNWRVYHESLGATKFLSLNLTNAVGTSSLEWNNTEPTSSIITVGTSDNINRNGDNIVMYAFADVEGFSKFGSYTGNGSADGSFVYTGFRPAFIMCKRTNNTGDWVINDTSRNTTNVANLWLYPNGAYADTTFAFCDILSNGFKIRVGPTAMNNSGDSYIYMAFAESPFKVSLAR